MKYLIIPLLFLCFSAQSQYEYTKTKAWGDGFLVLASFTDGFLEGYSFSGRTSFERMFDADPLSWGGSESWKRAYRNNDPTQGFKSGFRKAVGANDFYHLADDTRKVGYITAGVFIGIGFKDNKNWKHYAIDIGKSIVISMIAKRAGMSLARGENFFQL